VTFYHYEDSDGWLLATLNFIGRPASRGEVLNAGDFLNRARFSADEIDFGIRRLHRGGLAWHKDGKYGITSRGKWFVRLHGGLNPKMGEISLMLHLNKLMNGMKINVVNEEPAEPLSPRVFEEIDSWLLVSLQRMHGAGNWQELDKVLMTTTLGRLTQEQVDQAIARLQLHNLAEKKDNSYSITEKGRELVKKHTKSDDDWVLTLMGVSEELMNHNG